MPKKKNHPAAAINVPFEEAMERVETIVEAMETDALQLEDMLSQYEEGARLLAYCQQRIDAAQKRVELIVSERKHGAVTLKPFEKHSDDLVETSEMNEPSAAATSQTSNDASSAEGSDDIRLF